MMVDGRSIYTRHETSFIQQDVNLTYDSTDEHINIGLQSGQMEASTPMLDLAQRCLCWRTTITTIISQDESEPPVIIACDGTYGLLKKYSAECRRTFRKTNLGISSPFDSITFNIFLLRDPISCYLEKKIVDDGKNLWLSYIICCCSVAMYAAQDHLKTSP